jgi:hypothetical protein
MIGREASLAGGLIVMSSKIIEGTTTLTISEVDIPATRPTLRTEW